MNFNKEHYGTLFGERSSGSKWGFPMTLEILLNFEWVLKEKKTPYPGSDDVCTYYTAPSTNSLVPADKEPKFQCDVLTVETCLDNSISIVVTKGDHGLEMQVQENHIDKARGLLDKQTWNTVTLITGPSSKDDRTEIIWTVHPGPAMNPIPEKVNGKSVTKEMIEKAISKGYSLGTETILDMAVKISNLKTV